MPVEEKRSLCCPLKASSIVAFSPIGATSPLLSCREGHSIGHFLPAARSKGLQIVLFFVILLRVTDRESIKWQMLGISFSSTRNELKFPVLSSLWPRCPPRDYCPIHHARHDHDSCASRGSRSEEGHWTPPSASPFLSNTRRNGLTDLRRLKQCDGYGLNGSKVIGCVRLWYSGS